MGHAHYPLHPKAIAMCGRSLVAFAILFQLVTAGTASAQTLTKAPQPKVQGPEYPGVKQSGFLLPNGWTISPAGEQVLLTDLPLNILPLSDGEHALVATSGYNRHELSLVDLSAKSVLVKETVQQSWFGLAMDARAGRIWWSGGGNGGIHQYQLANHELCARVRRKSLSPHPRRNLRRQRTPNRSLRRLRLRVS